MPRLHSHHPLDGARLVQDTLEGIGLFGQDGLFGRNGSFGRRGDFGYHGVFGHRGPFGHYGLFGHRGPFGRRGFLLRQHRRSHRYPWRRRRFPRIVPVLLGLLLIGIVAMIMSARGEQEKNWW